MNRKQTVIQQLKEQTRKQIILEKAFKIAREGMVSKVGQNHWRVQSSSDKTPGLMYDVLFDTTLDTLTCSCPQFEHKLENCKHLIATAIFFGEGK
jgi:SWIM zinc finger